MGGRMGGGSIQHLGTLHFLCQLALLCTSLHTQPTVFSNVQPPCVGPLSLPAGQPSIISKDVIEDALGSVVLALSVVMAGSGHLPTFKLLRGEGDLRQNQGSRCMFDACRTNDGSPVFLHGTVCMWPVLWYHSAFSQPPPSHAERKRVLSHALPPPLLSQARPAVIITCHVHDLVGCIPAGLRKRLAPATLSNATQPSMAAPPTSSLNYGAHCAVRSVGCWAARGLLGCNCCWLLAGCLR